MVLNMVWVLYQVSLLGRWLTMLHVYSHRTFMTVMLVLLLVVLTDTSYANTSNALAPQQNVISGVLSYREWKNLKIQESKNKIRSLKEKINPDPNLKINDKMEAGLNQDLEQEILNLSITNDLGISDYFVGYLTKQSSVKTAIKEVSVKLSADEVAELMSAYAEHFFQNEAVPVRATLRNEYN